MTYDPNRPYPSFTDEQFMLVLQWHMRGCTGVWDVETPFFHNADGTIERERTLSLPCYAGLPRSTEPTERTAEPTRDEIIRAHNVVAAALKAFMGLPVPGSLRYGLQMQLDVLCFVLGHRTAKQYMQTIEGIASAFESLVGSTDSCDT